MTPREGLAEPYERRHPSEGGAGHADRLEAAASAVQEEREANKADIAAPFAPRGSPVQPAGSRAAATRFIAASRAVASRSPSATPLRGTAGRLDQVVRAWVSDHS